MSLQSVNLSASIRGILWMLGASLFYALIYLVVRGLSERFPANQIVLFRAILGAAFMLPWLCSAGWSALYTRRMNLYLWRMLVSYFGAVAWIYGIAYMPLAEANALLFTVPLFTVAFAAIWLSEHVGIDRWTATVVGFAGALIIIRPGLVEISLPALATLLAAALFSAAMIGTKKLTMTEDPNAMVFYLYTLMIPPAAVGAIWGWKDPELMDLPLLVALGLCTIGAQQCQTRSFRAAQASLVVIVNYVQLPLVAVLGWLVYGQTTDLWTWIGATVICGSTYYSGLREGRGSRRAGTLR